MFQLMRNIHLGLGLALFVMALMFALSSLFVVYRGWFPDEVTETERTVQVSAEVATTPRALALELIRNHGLKGDVLGIEQSAMTHFDQVVGESGNTLSTDELAANEVYVSRQLADDRPNLVELIEVPGAEHVQSWNIDRATFERSVVEFLESVAG